jgi:hypothetical protein
VPGVTPVPGRRARAPRAPPRPAGEARTHAASDGAGPGGHEARRAPDRDDDGLRRPLRGPGGPGGRGRGAGGRFRGHGAGRRADHAPRDPRPADLSRADHAAGGGARPRGGGPPVPELPGLGRGRRPQRRPGAQADRRRRREARGRARHGSGHPGDRPGGRPGDGAPRIHPAIGACVGGAPGAGPGARGRRAAPRRHPGGGGGGSLRRGAGTHAGRRRGRGDPRAPHPDHRHRGRTGMRRPDPDPARPPRAERGLRPPVPEAIRRPGPRGAPGGGPLRRGGPGGDVPRPGARPEPPAYLGRTGRTIRLGCAGPLCSAMRPGTVAVTVVSSSPVLLLGKE